MNAKHFEGVPDQAHSENTDSKDDLFIPSPNRVPGRQTGELNPSNVEDR